MALGFERAPRSASSAEDRGEELRAEMAVALGGDVGARMRACAQSLPAGGRVVVLGCGAGDVLEALRETSANLHGVESSPALVQQCRARGFDVELAPLGSGLGSLEEESLSGLVVTRVTDRHPEDHWPALVAGAWRSLRPGGVVIFEGIRDGDARLAWLLARQRFILLGGREATGAEPPAAERVIVGRRSAGP